MVQFFLVDIVVKTAGFLTAEDILDTENWRPLEQGRRGMLAKIKYFHRSALIERIITAI
jgi:hypothetical protein